MMSILLKSERLKTRHINERFTVLVTRSTKKNNSDNNRGLSLYCPLIVTDRYQANCVNGHFPRYRS